MPANWNQLTQYRALELVYLDEKLTDSTGQENEASTRGIRLASGNPTASRVVLVLTNRGRPTPAFHGNPCKIPPPHSPTGMETHHRLRQLEHEVRDLRDEVQSLTDLQDLARAMFEALGRRVMELERRMPRGTDETGRN